jgi:next-to-BRCA1 protein 1
MNKRTCSGCPPEPGRPQVAPPVPNPIAAPATKRDVTTIPVVHRDVICDICEHTVVGVRHKCLDCPGKFMAFIDFTGLC